jgi:SHS2 domain-containing protein
MGYRVIDHTADLGIEIEADSVDELFGEAALALADCVTEVAAIEARGRRELQVVSNDLESLLVDWLSELLFVFETKGELYSAADAEVSRTERGWRVVASVRGEVFDGERHLLKVPVKAVTYHGLEVVEHEGEWRARVILDI